MLSLVRWAVDTVVLLLALYAFAFLPIGNRSGLEHTRAILRTPEAKEAGRQLLSAGERLRDELFDRVRVIETRGEPILPDIAPASPRAPDPAGTHGGADRGVHGRP